MAEAGRGVYIAEEGSNNLENEARAINRGIVTKTVAIQGFSSDTNQEVLELYFENSRRSGGGDIVEFEIMDGIAYVTFKEVEVTQRVVSRRSHQVAGQTLSVTLFCPPPEKPCYENRVFILGLNCAITEELLTNFLEIETGMNIIEFLYGEEEKVVVTFSDDIDFPTLRNACKERSIEGTFLQVAKVATSNCILVRNLQPSTSHDTILFYFENQKRSHGGEIERVEMNTDERYCLVYFKDNCVIDRVLSQSHRVDAADVEVHLHHECLGRRSSVDRSDPFFRISSPGSTCLGNAALRKTEYPVKEETSGGVLSSPVKESKFVDISKWQQNEGNAVLEKTENPAKEELISSNVSINPDEESNFDEVTEWQENEGRNYTLSLLVKYRKSQGKKTLRNMKEVPSNLNFLAFWNFYTKLKQGQQMLNEFIGKQGCSVSVSNDDDALFIFEIRDRNFEQESEISDFINIVLDDVYKCAQESLYSDIIFVDHRMQADILQRVRQAKELDCAWIDFIDEQDHDAMYIVCTEDHKASILKMVTTIIADSKKCFENHEEEVTVDSLWQKVLKTYGYLQELNGKFPNISVLLDEIKGVFVLKGPRDESKAAADYLLELLGMAHTHVHEEVFSPGCQFEILTYPAMCEYVNNCIQKPSASYTWMPNVQTKNVHIFSTSSEEVRGLDKLIKGCIKEKAYVFSKANEIVQLEKGTLLQDLKEKYKGKVLICVAGKDTLVVTTADDIFESVDDAIQEIIRKERCTDPPLSITEKGNKKDEQAAGKSELKAIKISMKTKESYPEKKDTSDPSKGHLKEIFKLCGNSDKHDVNLEPSNETNRKLKAKGTSDKKDATANIGEATGSLFGQNVQESSELKKQDVRCMYEEMILSSAEEQIAGKAVSLVNNEFPAMQIVHTFNRIMMKGHPDSFEKAKHKLKVALGRVQKISEGTRGRNQPADGRSFSSLPQNVRMEESPMSMQLNSHKSIHKVVITSKTYYTSEGITVKVYQGDIVRLPVDCIVNSSNKNLSHGGGLALAIAKAAGREFYQESEDYVKRNGIIPVTQCCVTTAGCLPYICVINVVGPQWHDYKPDEKDRCGDDLKKAIVNCLIEATRMKVTSIAIPSISSGLFGVPKQVCAQMYAQGVIEFSKTFDPQSIKEIHFVDMISEMCQLIQLAFDTKLSSPSNNNAKNS